MNPPHYGMWLPTDISQHGHRIDAMINWLHVFMIALFVGWGIFFVMCLVKFRKRDGHKAVYEPIHGSASKAIEVAVVVIEMIFLIVLSMPIWAEYKTMPPKDKNPLEIRIVGEQFQWNAHYPGPDGIFGATKAEFVKEGTNPLGLDPNDPNGKDDITSEKIGQGQLFIPKDRPVIIHLRSKDVIHSFFIPVLRVKQDAIPGMDIPIWFQANETGDYEIACAQLCGLGHYKMRGEVHIKTPEEFDAWQKTAAKGEEFNEEETK